MEQEVDLEGDGDGYSGTFRWKRTKKLQSMPAVGPPVKTRLEAGSAYNLQHGQWMNYFVARSTTDDAGLRLIAQVQQDLAMIDCLSTPLSIVFGLQKMGLLLAPDSTATTAARHNVHVVLMGASEKAEERILRETNMFNELAHAVGPCVHVHLYFVGPEVIN